MLSVRNESIDIECLDQMKITNAIFCVCVFFFTFFLDPFHEMENTHSHAWKFSRFFSFNKNQDENEEKHFSFAFRTCALFLFSCFVFDEVRWNILQKSVPVDGKMNFEKLQVVLIRLIILFPLSGNFIWVTEL